MTSINLPKLTLLLLSMLTIMAAAIVAPSIPEIARVFSHVPHSTLLSKLVVSLPTLFIAITAPIVGSYIDKNGRLKLLYIGLVLYMISGTSGFYLNNIYYILLGRVLLGVSIGIIMTISVTLVGDYFKGLERQNFMGFQSAFIGFAGIVFLLAGGALADISWRFPFLIYIIPLFYAPLIIRFLNEPASPHVVHTSSPAGPKLLIRIIFINAIVLMVLFYIIPTQLPFLLHGIGLDNTLSGTALSVNALGMVVSSLSYSGLKRQVSFPYVYTIAFFFMATGYFITGMTVSFGIILIAMFCAGLGIGLLITNTNLWVMELSHHELRGRNIGTLTTFLFLGQFLSPIVFEPVVRQFGLAFLFGSTGAFMAVLSLLFLWAGKLLVRMGEWDGA